MSRLRSVTTTLVQTLSRLGGSTPTPHSNLSRMRGCRTFMEDQSFTGNPLVRGLRRGATLETALRSPGARFLPVSERRVGVDPDGGLAWLTPGSLAGAGLRLDPGAEHLAAQGDIELPLYTLGLDREAWHFAVDVSSLGPEAPALPRLAEVRSLMPLLPTDQLAIAGQAVALAQWHAAHAFCPRCGAPTRSAEGGARRQCQGDAAHRLYPRTDPVVIMLVESADGSAALVGRPLNYRAGNMLTCLSGFVDQGESIEEAVLREVAEEAGLKLARVEILGSQPWPIGRGGSCELMIGCVAKATSNDIDMDAAEMAIVQWLPREDVRKALKNSGSAASPLNGGNGAGMPFFLPPPYAIAHHLLKSWAERDGSWFAEAQTPALARI
ncbi:Nudix hydrolase 19, chloroplastic [Auxenochlorella protothecoides]|uniref:NAD(+) diphosphatase n=1 Tax=Auxenochlorella protothecoides TaxID=3075 RepID=A0A087SHU9_AUXPR|nr:Nudix hydrolase 19, chloroplastic [Auxenochlorella protothecoides]KFM25303.1 Nudix hydrolase 19, chloroplastic [Auxenochlorella protothecoides]RMZ57630.1 hypothetical protein APUTEX25_001830 [Auxenochlorella protothecoides]|eukprot:RMZ57630.1 hypothetical protein APUTEX25_001830 [Auxenochlorella protothecoides]